MPILVYIFGWDGAIPHSQCISSGFFPTVTLPRPLSVRLIILNCYPKKVAYRPTDDIKLIKTQNYFKDNRLEYNAKHEDRPIICLFQLCVIACNRYIYIEGKTITIPYKYILRQLWMTSALLKCSR